MPTGISSKDDLADETLISCGDCGAVFAYGEIVAACKAEVTKRLVAPV
jgi:hypothetical protein